MFLLCLFISKSVIQGSCNSTYLRPTMASSFGPPFQYERPPPEPLLAKHAVAKVAIDGFHKGSQSWLAKNRSTDRPRPIVLALHGRRKGPREEGRKEGRKIITARAHFGEINRVLITRPSREGRVCKPHTDGTEGTTREGPS